MRVAVKQVFPLFPSPLRLPLPSPPLSSHPSPSVSLPSPSVSPSFPPLSSHPFPSLQVRSMVWNNDDTHLVSCSTDGAVYEWNMQSYRREKDCVVKNCSYTSVAITADMKATFAVGSDCTLKEINLADAAVSWDKTTPDFTVL